MNNQFAREKTNLPEALGQSEAFLDFQQRLSRVAKVDRPVLIIGERGTGKELVASRLHFLSPRWEGPLVTLHCAALTASLLETELFGHEAGAFTGATRQRRGRFETADGGTLFLDEIGLIPMEVQEKILRAVEYGSYERVGSSEAIKTDVRIIGATNADLPALVREEKFKEDLLDRLSFEVLKLPPLRERHGDVLLLAHHFAARMAMEIGRESAPSFSPKAIDQLESYDWPGNVRELKNVVERAVYRCDGAEIKSIDFDPFGALSGKDRKKERSDLSPSEEWPPVPCNLPALVRQVEKEAARKALAQNRHNQSQAAQALGITYHQFRSLYRKYKREL